MDEVGAIITEGREALQRIRDRDKATFDDWLAVGRALIAGRTECMAKAGVNKPYGPAYQRLTRAFLERHGLADIDSHERVGAIHCVEHQAEIEAWRAGLTDVQRRRANHPNTIMAHWRRHTVPQKPGPKASDGLVSRTIGRVVARHPRAHDRMIHWPQDHLRRAADAIRKSRSTDCIVLARAALEAAIQSEADLYAVLDANMPRAATRLSAPVLAEAIV